MNLSNYLDVFNQVLSRGQQCDGKFYFYELSAWHDSDRYTCYIQYKDLIMIIPFHSKFSFEYINTTTLNEFIDCVDDRQALFREKKCA